MHEGSYAWEKLYNAVGTLAAGQGTLRQRLRSTYSDHLVRLFKPDHHFPWPSLRARFEAVMADLDDGRVDRLSHPKAKRLSIEIVDIYSRVTRHMEPLE